MRVDTNNASFRVFGTKSQAIIGAIGLCVAVGDEWLTTSVRWWTTSKDFNLD